MPRRIIMRLELTPSAKKGLAEISEHHGMTQVSTMSRMVEWFARQPPVIRAAVLGHYPPEIECDVAKILLQRMAGSDARPNRQ